MARNASGTGKAWVMQNHDQASVIEAAQRPDTTVSKGERGKICYGPFADRAAAQKYADGMNVRTLRTQSER